MVASTGILFLITGSVGAQLPTPFYCINDGTANVLCSQPFSNGEPVSNTNPMAVTTAPAVTTQVPLDATVVTAEGTAVTAIAAGHRTQGAVIQTSNPAGFYVNEIGTATLSVDGGGTVFVPANTIYRPAASVNAVSVNATVSGLILSGWGLT